MHQLKYILLIVFLWKRNSLCVRFRSDECAVIIGTMESSIECTRTVIGGSYQHYLSFACVLIRPVTSCEEVGASRSHNNQILGSFHRWGHSGLPGRVGLCTWTASKVSVQSGDHLQRNLRSSTFTRPIFQGLPPWDSQRWGKSNHSMTAFLQLKMSQVSEKGTSLIEWYR